MQDKATLASTHEVDSRHGYAIRKLGLSHILLMSLATLFTATAANATDAATGDLIHVRLKDRLDRSVDGYCFDILGTGRHLRLDLPLFAHNCKDGATPDSAVIYTSLGQFVFPAANVCITAFGVNDTVLPGTPVLLRPCEQRTPFFETSNLQKFDHIENGQLKLRGSELCLAVGNESSSTYSPSDRWRVLSLQSCASTALSHSAWERVPLRSLHGFDQKGEKADTGSGLAFHKCQERHRQ